MKMNRILMIIVLLLGSMTATAQNLIYELHPAVGDTIDNDEIRKYYLFNDYAIDTIDYLVIYKDTDADTNSFTLKGFSDNKKIVEMKLSSNEVLLQKEQIEKLNNYYVSKAKKDSCNLKINPLMPDTLNVKDIDLNIATPEFMKSVKKDMRRKFWDEKRKETKENRRRGMFY